MNSARKALIQVVHGRSKTVRKPAALAEFVFNVSFTDWNGTETRDDASQHWTRAPAAGFVDLPGWCEWKLLAHPPGNTYSAALKYRLACGSVAVVIDNEFDEWWCVRCCVVLVADVPTDSHSLGTRP